MKPKKWNTPRLALYGAFVGAAFILIRGYIEPSYAPVEFNVGEVVGGAVGGAALVAIVSGVRNMFVR